MLLYGVDGQIAPLLRWRPSDPLELLDQITFASLVMAEIEGPDFRTMEANC